jgi:hypothetical protein
MLETLAAAVAGDEDLRAYCLATYGRDLTVQVGENPENPASESIAPYVVFMPDPGGVDLGVRVESRMYGIMVGMGVVNASRVTTVATDESAAIIRYGNVAALDAFAVAVWSIIRAAVPAQYQASAMSLELDTVLPWPLAEALLRVTIEAENVL